MGRLPGWAGRCLAPLGALVVELAGVLFTNMLISFWIPATFYEITIAVVLLGALALMLALRLRLLRRPDGLARLVPQLLHVFYLAAGLISGVLFQPPFLLAVSLLMFAIAVFVHRSRQI